MAGIESHYCINVAKLGQLRFMPVVASARERYQHFLRIELGPCRDEAEALAMLADTRARYPGTEFKVDMTRWECSGRSVGGEG